MKKRLRVDLLSATKTLKAATFRSKIVRKRLVTGVKTRAVEV